MASSQVGPRLSRRDMLKMFAWARAMAGLAACRDDGSGGEGR